MSTPNNCSVEKKVSPVAKKPKLTAISTSSLITSESSSSSSPPVKRSVEPQPPEVPTPSNFTSFLIKDILSKPTHPPQRLHQHHYQLGQNQSTPESTEENKSAVNDKNEKKIGIEVNTHKKKERTVFTDRQHDALEVYFKHYKYPDTQERMAMAAKLNLSEYKVKIWYQNRRSKQNRLSAPDVKMHDEINNYAAVRRTIEMNQAILNRMTNILPQQMDLQDMYQRQAALYPSYIYPNFSSSSVPSSHTTQSFSPSSSSTSSMHHEPTDQSG